MTGTNTLQRAQWFLKQGLSVIPLDHPAETTHTDPSKIGKVPAIERWKPFQTMRATDADLQEWFGSGRQRNIGVITGSISNLVVVDCDSVKAVVWADAHLPPTPWRSHTSKGEHRGYRHPGIQVKNKVRINTGSGDTPVDVRGDGGYIVAPGSVHYCGARYEWAEEPPATDSLPMFDPAWIETDPSVSEATQPLGTTIPSGSRNDTLFREGCRLRRLGYDEVEIQAALTVLNKRRCSPPLDAREIESIAQSCARYEPAADIFATTESGDSEYFAACNADTVRYDHRRGRFLLFDGHIWVPQTNGEVSRLALEAMRARLAAAVKSTGDGRTKRIKWAIDGEARKRLSNLLYLAQDKPQISDPGDSWDLDPWLLGAANGVIDLRAGTLRAGHPDDRITMRVRVSFDPNAECPLYDRTVDEIFESNAELIAYFDRYVGYSLTGDCREESLAFCYGDGANGKGTLMNTIGWMLGDYADDLPFSAFELQSRAGIPNDIAKIVGKRFITASETAEAQRLNESRVKALTGRDPITARFLNKEFFTFQPVAKFWLATNHKPEVRDDSEGFWRRLHLIPFAASFVGREDKSLKDRLRAELPGILARAVRGCLAWQREGLNPPEVVREATQSYRNNSMPLARFLDECCVVQDAARATFGELFKAYVKWCGNSREGRMGRHEFNEALRQRFEQDARNTQRVTFVGVGLLDLFGAEGDDR